jgi:hypothetical protein
VDTASNIGEFLTDNTMVWRRQLDVAPERLWNTIATKHGLALWFMPTELEIEQGARFAFVGGWEGTISDLSPLRHRQFDVDGKIRGCLRFEMIPNEAGCLFSLTDRMGDDVDSKEIFGPDATARRIHQPGGRGTHWSGVAAGYHAFIDSLQSLLTGIKSDPNDDEMCRTYKRVLGDRFGGLGDGSDSQTSV